MARKVSVTKESIIDSAFLIASEEGLPQVTARRLAAKIGCSTQPIFRVYTGMDKLYDEVYEKAISCFQQYYKEFPIIDSTPFVNLGLAYIQFAATKPHLFRMLFLGDKREGKSLYDLLNGESGAVVREISKANAAGCTNASELFMEMWIFIHGAASMSTTGDYDLDKEETVNLLIKTYHAYTRRQGDINGK